MLKKLFAGLFLLVILAGLFVSWQWFAEKPLSLRVFLDREMLRIALDEPQTLTSLGFLEAVGIKGHNAHLDDMSIEHETALFRRLAHIRTVLLQYDEASLDDAARLSRRIALEMLDTLPLEERYRFHDYPVNQLFGIQNEFPSFMDSDHQIETREDAENYIARLGEVERQFGQVLDGLRERERRGILPPRFVVDRVLAEMNQFVGQPVQENILYTSAKKKMNQAEDWNPEDTDEMLHRIEVAIEQHVHPAYQLLIGYFESIRDKTGTDVGYWHLPDGEGAYQLALKRSTTTDLSAEEIHQMGLQEVARIQRDILDALHEQGIDTGGGFRSAIEQLASQDRFYFEDSDAGRQQMLDRYTRLLEEIGQGLGDAFHRQPRAAIEVRRIPEFKEKTAPGAYYKPPSVDGSRPGRFFANLYDVRATPKYEMPTLAYHEGIPGHHFQIALAMELEGLPLFRKFPLFTAYSEGWALYAERLAWELGFEKDPFDNIGRQLAELFRAVRLVVDTGIHAKRWTREQAIDYMKQNTGMAESDIVSEVERYIVMPGQATAYKVGMMKILALREKMKNALGDRFKLADFHDIVLKNGAVPLNVLEALVEDYIARKG